MDLGGLLFYYVMLGSTVLLMAIRVGRSSTGMGFVTFLFWPLAVIPLMTNWGVRGSDIRLHFALTLFATGMLIYKSNQAVDHLASHLSEADIAMIRQSDPRSAAEIERRQMQALGVDTVATRAAAPPPVARNASRVAPASDTTGDALDFVAAPPQMHRVPLAELHFRRNQIRLGPAYAVLTVPEHFRFISAQQLGLLSETRGVAVPQGVLGWIVHERVDLGAADFWFVEVRFYDVGHLAQPGAVVAEAGPAGPVPDADGRGLIWNRIDATAQWSSSNARAPAPRRDQLAAKLLRHGVVVYRVPDLDPSRNELGLRATRLMARQTIPEAGWSYDEFTGPQMAQSLSQWIAANESAQADSARADTVSASGTRGS